jgi:hypothetical protein
MMYILLMATVEENKNQAAAELGKLGGQKTAERGPEYYAEIQAQRKERKGGRPKNPPVATHDGTIEIAGRTIACAVLADGKRVLTQETFLSAIGRSRKGKGGQIVASPDGFPPFLAAENLRPFISEELREATAPYIYRSRSGRNAYGYDAMLLPMVCEVYLNAKDASKTTRQQAHIVKACDLLTRGLARVGIIALVDEATGYQDVRDRKALQQILDQYIGKELAKWAKRFPDEFYEQMFRLRGWTYDPYSSKRPMAMAKLTVDLVFDRIGPGLTKELKDKELERRQKEGGKRHLHRWLTPDIGHPALSHHLSGLTFLAKAFPDGDWEGFHRAVDRVTPKYNRTLLLPFTDEDIRPEVRKLKA